MVEENLIREFIAEAEDHLFSIEPNLLRLEKEPDNTELVNEIFLATHGLKGTASYVGLSDISGFTHALETVLDRLRKHELTISQELIDVLLEGVDMLKVLIQHVSLGNPLPDTAALENKLARWHVAEISPETADAAFSTPSSSAPRAESGSDLPEFSLSAETLQALDPEDLDIFTDVAGQQVEFMRLAFERLRAPAPHAETDAAPVPAALQSLLKAVRTIQSSAAMLSLETIHAKLDQDAQHLINLEQAAAPLSDQDMARLETMIENLTFMLRRLSDTRPQETPPEEPTSSSVPTSALTDASLQPHTLRVNAERVDHLLNLVAELVINRAKLDRIGGQLKTMHEDARAGRAYTTGMASRKQKRQEVRTLKRLKDTFEETTLELGRLTTQLQESAMRIRMIPISQIVNRFPRMVRDLSRQAGKEVRIELYGTETELDKTVIDILADPLIHILRNAIDHGIELPEERQQTGKPPQGQITLSASHQGNQVVIEVRDDGRGIDLDQVKQTAIEQQITTLQEAQTLSEKEAACLIFHPGFSTVKTVSNLSGRGVGLHIVKHYLEKLNGAVELETTPGQGSRFVIRLPLTLAIISALMVHTQAEDFAIPLTSVEEAVRIQPHDITTIESHQVIRLRERMIPLVQLTDLLGTPVFAASSHTPDQESTADDDEMLEPEQLYGVILSDGYREIGLQIDRLIGERDIVIKPLDDDLLNVPGVLGASIQGDGSVALVLDTPSLIDLAIARVRDNHHQRKAESRKSPQ